MGEGLRFVRRFHFARGTVLTRVAGFGENIVPLWEDRIFGNPANPTKLVQGLRENGRLHDGPEGGQGGGRTGDFSIFHELKIIHLPDVRHGV